MMPSRIICGGIIILKKRKAREKHGLKKRKLDSLFDAKRKLAPPFYIVSKDG